MSRIFISYRRSDSAYVSDAIYKALVEHFGREHVFKDVDNIPPGVNFKKHLTEKVTECEVLVVVMGSQWLEASDERGRRLEHPTDFVRIELEAALERQVPVIPVFVNDTSMPGPSQLPASIADLSYFQGIPLRPAPDFDRDMEKLLHAVALHIPKLQSQKQPTSPAQPTIAAEGAKPVTTSPSRSLVAPHFEEKEAQVWRLTTHWQCPEQAAEIYQRQGFIAVGWGQIGDLRDMGLRNADGIVYAIKRAYPFLRNIPSGKRSLWALYQQMKPGDLVILSAKGRRVHVMQVTGDYRFNSEVDPVLGDFQHQRPAVPTSIDPNELWECAGSGFAESWNSRWTLGLCVNTVIV